MKQIIALVAFLAVATFAKADNYQYLVLEQTDGTTIKLVASGLTMTFQNGQLVASDGTTVSLTSLSQMYFANTDTAIREMDVNGGDSSVEVYTISGARLGAYASAEKALQSLQHGVYIVKSNGKTQKITVR